MPKRYFENKLSDNDGNCNASYGFWKDKINSLIECVSDNSSSSENILYTGSTGIAYMFYYLAITDKFKHNSSALLNKAVDILNVSKIKENNFHKKGLCQFICGDAGVNAVSAAIFYKKGDVKTAEIYLEQFKIGVTVCKPIDFYKYGGDELFVGRAGYLYGVLWLEKVFGKKIVPDQDIIELCSTIVESGRIYSEKNNSIFPLMYSYHQKEYLGKFNTQMLIWYIT